MSRLVWLTIFLNILYISHFNCEDDEESYETCGIRPGKNPRIVGGTDARPHSWPWLANLLDTSKKHICGGTVVQPNKIVTAAHCFRDRQKSSKYYIRLGSHNLHEMVEGEVELKVVKIVLHEKYNREVDKSNDIAILTLEKAVNYNETIRPLCLDTTIHVPENITCYVAGWGHTEEYGVTSNTLQELEVPLINATKCSKLLGKMFVGESQLCGGFEEGGKDSCQGDSGGPLSCQYIEDGPWFLTGFVSWGTGCARKDSPGAYTKVGYFVDWINKHLDD